MHKCTTCGRAFTRRPNLQRHASGCRPKPFVCDVCRRSFTRERNLDRHKRTMQCGGPPQPGPAPKRRRIVASLNEDPVLAVPVEHAANDELSSAIRDFVHENWGSVRTHVVHGPIQTRYNRRLTSLDMRDLHDQLFLLFDQQTTAFKVNVSFGFVLREKENDRLRYYHSSNNCCGRYLEEPALITNRDDFDRFLARIQESDILQWAVAQRPNSDWVCELVTNATFFLNKIVDHPIGCVGVNLPTYVKNNKSIIGLETDSHGVIYIDNLCLFRCLGLHLGREAAALYAEYTDTSVHDFAGVTLDDLHKVESKFETNVVVYQLVEIDNGKTISDAVFDMLMPSYDNVLNELEVRKDAWDEAERKAPREDDSKLEEVEVEESKTNPYKTLIGQLLGWLHQLPVIGFNSGRYDLNVIKQFFIPYLLKPSKQDNEEEEADETRFVIKRQNTFMCFATKKLKFLDITSYLAPGFSYDKYLKAYGCELQKGHFPYEYMDGIGKLEDRALPPQAAFYSQLKSEEISDADYARCQAVWHDNQMTTMRDYLIWYNNRDVTPFLEAIAKQFTFYCDRGIDMFKDGISVPGLSLLYLFSNLPKDTFFTVFNNTNKDAHKLVKDNIVGGPAIIFHRYHEKGITKIRGGSELCRKIVGYDANALYLWALMQDMPTGWYVRRREENVRRRRVTYDLPHHIGFFVYQYAKLRMLQFYYDFVDR